jgi:hypothetical protein
MLQIISMSNIKESASRYERTKEKNEHVLCGGFEEKKQKRN